jgi:hypothetical protein
MKFTTSIKVNGRIEICITEDSIVDGEIKFAASDVEYSTSAEFSLDRAKGVVSALAELVRHGMAEMGQTAELFRSIDENFQSRDDVSEPRKKKK